MSDEKLQDLISIEDFNYNLPSDRIAKHPLAKRDESKLLYYADGKCNNKNFSDLKDLLDKDDLLVFNNTKVIRARIPFFKKTGAKIEIFCLEPYLPEDFQMSFESKSSCQWICLVGNLKKWKNNEIESRINFPDEEVILKATKKGRVKESVIIEFSWNNNRFSFAEILEKTGITPIPPYLNRDSEKEDIIRYQTVYSKIKGSVAAPTAGLHFTEKVFNDLTKKGIHTKEVTLHVSAGTFKPVSAENITEHEMHSEHIFVSKKLIEHILSNRNKRIIAVGTTSVRTLESLYWIGNKISNKLISNPKNIHINQWDAYNMTKTLSCKESLNHIIEFMETHSLDNLEASTQIIIVPGYKFKLVSGLITNFHMPKSTLLLLIAAMTGEEWKAIYDFALNNDYRFLSYGDSSLIFGK